MIKKIEVFILLRSKYDAWTDAQNGILNLILPKMQM